MDGLSNHVDNNNIINIWYNLFKEQNKIYSEQKCQYWKKIEQYRLLNINNEKWKYVPWTKLLANKFINPSPNHNIDILDRDNVSFDIKSYRLVFINGFFSQELSNQDTGPWEIKTINRNIKQIIPEPIQPEIFVYLTECLSYETTFISLPSNTISKIPLYLLHISQGSNKKNTLINFHYRNHIKIHKHSYGKIIEHFTSINKNSHFTGARASIMLDDYAKIEYIKLIFENLTSYHISHNDIHLNYHSSAKNHVFNIFGNNFNQNQTSAILKDQFASLSLNSLSLPLEKNIHNISTFVKHNAPGNNSSKQIHKIIVGNQGEGIFNGLIQVDKKAVKINGNMLNKNLLLNKLSKVYSTPQLEIYADDVKCNHGTTVGYINNEQIFYLCTRGIPYEEACQIIVYAFGYEIIETINHDSIKQKISENIINVLTRIFKHDISNRKNSI